MTQATWNGRVIAESEHTEILEGNHYFPPDSINQEFFQPSSQTTTCPWKGTAHYYDLVVDGETNSGAAWYYPEPKSEAGHIGNYVAFWKGVVIK